MRRCLIVFAKEPKSGKVKTRLKGFLSSVGSLNLYIAFLKDTAAIAGKINCQDKILAYESGKNNCYQLRKIFRNFNFYPQKGRDLGERMHNAFKFAAEKGASGIIIIGSDSPALPASYIKAAFQYLRRKDAVLGPSFDGGYYLIGLRKPCFSIFKGIKWSSREVFADTIKKLKKAKKTIAILNYWYDIDEPKDLGLLKAHLNRIKSKNTAQWTRKILDSITITI